MKKVILALIVVIIVFSFTVPIYADQPPDPGANGRNLGGIAREEPGKLAEILTSAIARIKAGEEGLLRNLGAYLSDNSSLGIPPKHTP